MVEACSSKPPKAVIPGLRIVPRPTTSRDKKGWHAVGKTRLPRSCRSDRMGYSYSTNQGAAEQAALNKDAEIGVTKRRPAKKERRIYAQLKATNDAGGDPQREIRNGSHRWHLAINSGQKRLSGADSKRTQCLPPIPGVTSTAVPRFEQIPLKGFGMEPGGKPTKHPGRERRRKRVGHEVVGLSSFSPAESRENVAWAERTALTPVAVTSK